MSVSRTCKQAKDNQDISGLARTHPCPTTGIHLRFRPGSYTRSTPSDHSPDHARALGLLSRPLCALGLLARPLRAPTTSITSRAAPLSSDHISGTSSVAPRPVLGDFVTRSSTCARGLPRSLFDHGSGTLRLDYMRQATRIQLGIFFLI